MTHPTTWILVADSARARLFAATGESGTLETLSESVCAEARQRTLDRGTDRPGRVQESANTAHHAMEPPTDPKVNEIKHFVKGIAQQLNEDVAAGKFARLIIAAPPQVLGYYRDHLSGAVKDKVLAEIPKSFAQLKSHEILGRLKASTDVWLGSL